MKSNSKMKLELILFCLVGLAYGRDDDPIVPRSACGMYFYFLIHIPGMYMGNFYIDIFHILKADMPDFMTSSKIVGGEAAPTMIPWQVALLSGSFQFCGGTVLDSCTILTAAHCAINTGHKIRAGSISKSSGGQVCIY